MMHLTSPVGETAQGQRSAGVSADFAARLWPWALFAGLLCWAAILLFSASSGDQVQHLLIIAGTIAVWRYSWGLVHFVRATLYLRVVFPRLNECAVKADLPRAVGHAYGIVCSFGTPEAEFRATYTALIANCLEAGIPATIVASVTSDRHCAILAEVLRGFGQPASIRIIIQFQEGLGKREAMAMALRAIGRLNPSPNSGTFLLDGDVVLDPGALRAALSFLAADPELAAVTTNNDAQPRPGDPVQHWYRLRFAQRHMLMSSLSLSRRLLVLTGRFSVIRTQHTIQQSFIDRLENDRIDHWLHGTIRLLSGDDKSVWYHVLSDGGKMLYLPHVKAISFEAMPGDIGFFPGSTQLMLRWFGNMIRSNGRALRLGPRRCGLFLWWCLLDQRVSMITTLLGLLTALMLGLFAEPQHVLFYAAWVALSRSVMAGAYGALWGGFHPSWPGFLAYGQLWGSLLKFHLLFRPDRQRWVRQNIDRNDSTLLARTTANGMNLVAFAILIFAATWLAGLLAVD